MNEAQSEKKPRSSKPAVSRYLSDGTQIELIYDPDKYATAFAVWAGGRWTIEQEVTVGRDRLVPFSPNNNLIKNQAVLLPSEPIEYHRDDALIEELQEFLHRYLDLEPTFETVAVHYVLLSWLYDAFSDLPYLRLRGDFGTGKTRALLVIGSLCYKPFFASGASTVSPIFHTLDAFRGTLIFDEADFRFSDEKAEVVKILNNGNVRGMPVLRTMMNQQKEFNPQAFQVFGPKILATRQTYDDKGLESRFLTYEMRPKPLRAGIPINLPPSFPDEARQLRNKLLLYRFRHRGSARLDPSQVDGSLEPRLNQILLPLLSIASEPGRRHALRMAAAEAQTNLVAERGFNVEAHVLEALVGLMEASDRAVVPVGEVASAVKGRFGEEYERPITNRWIGGILRRRLNVRTYKSHGVYVVPMTERSAVDLLCSRYGVYTVRDVQKDMAVGDGGTTGMADTPAGKQ